MQPRQDAVRHLLSLKDIEPELRKVIEAKAAPFDDIAKPETDDYVATARQAAPRFGLDRVVGAAWDGRQVVLEVLP